MNTPTYTTSVSVIDVTGGAFPQMTARLWMLWTTVGGPGSGPQQQEAGSQTVTAGGNATISFFGPADFSYASRSVGLSIQDEDRVASDEGWWFRSGSFPTTLPAQPVEVVLAGPVNRTAAEIAMMIPTLPLVLERDAAGTAISSITAATLTPKDDGTLDLIASGTTSRSPLPAPVGFTYTLTFSIFPSTSIANAETEVFTIGAANRGSLTFVSTGSMTSAFEAAFLNTINDLLEREIFPQFRRTLQFSINSGVLASIANLIAPGTTTLPAGIIVSARTVVVRSGGMTVRAALGAYGGVLNKFPSLGGGGSSSTCPLKMSALLTALELGPFRQLRDGVLSQTPQGQALVEIYYRYSEEVVRLMLARPDIAQALFDLLPDLAQGLSSTALPASLRQRFERTLRLIGEAGSAPMRSDIEWALAATPWPGN